jgi:hypothetical protein
MLDRTSPQLHGLWPAIEPALHVVKHWFVFPASDSPVPAGRASIP